MSRNYRESLVKTIGVAFYDIVRKGPVYRGFVAFAGKGQKT